MLKWVKNTYKYDKMYRWKAKPGYNIFVADRGAVRFDFPEKWVVEPDDDGSIKFHDRQPPDDDCRLQVSVFHLRPDIDWSALPLAPLLEHLSRPPDLDDEPTGPITEVKQAGLEVARQEFAFVDKKEGATRARAAVLLVAPMSRYSSFLARRCGAFHPVWDEVLRTLRLGDYGPQPIPRGRG